MAGGVGNFTLGGLNLACAQKNMQSLYHNITKVSVATASLLGMMTLQEGREEKKILYHIINHSTHKTLLITQKPAQSKTRTGHQRYQTDAGEVNNSIKMPKPPTIRYPVIQRIIS